MKSGNPSASFELIENALCRVGTDSSAKDSAFRILYEDGCQVLQAFLRRKGVPEEEREEIVQDIFVRILQNWNRLSFDSRAAWYGYIYKAARNAVYKESPQYENGSAEHVPHPANMWEHITHILDADRLFEAADSTWFGSCPKDSNIRCLAAQYLYIDGQSLEDVFGFVSDSTASDKPSDSDSLHEWLSDSWVLRKVAFQALYLSNDSLTALLLESPHFTSQDIDAISKMAKNRLPSEHAIGNWKWGDVEFILLRYRYGVTMSAAASKVSGHITLERTRTISAKCLGCFPFVEIMSSLWSKLNCNTGRERALNSNELWKRLVFQYYAAHELSQDDILDRVSPPAAVSGYTINNINTWIASRLVENILKTIKKRSEI